MRIVSRELVGSHGLARLGFDFTETIDFWGIEFPAGRLWWEIPSR